MSDKEKPFYENEFDIPVAHAKTALTEVKSSLTPTMAERFDMMFRFFAGQGFEASAREYATYLTPGTQDVKSANTILGRIARAMAEHLGFKKHAASDQYQVVLMTHHVDAERGTVWHLRPCYQEAWLQMHPWIRPTMQAPVRQLTQATTQSAFLYTWKRGGKGQGDEGISGLADGQTCDWPIKSFRQAKTGDAFVLLKQGIHDNPGIIGYGTIIDDRKHDEQEEREPRPYRMDIVLTRFRHPDQGLLLTQQELLALGFPAKNFLKQGSGHPMPMALAQSIIEAIEAKVLEASLLPERREVFREEMVRNRAHILELKAMAGGRCQLTGELVAGGLGGDLTEGHHIHWLSCGGPDTKANIVIISPDMHALVHRKDTQFDWSDLSFIVNGKRLPLQNALHLQRVPGKVTNNMLG